MNRHYRKYEPLSARFRRLSAWFRRMCKYPFVALSIVFSLFAAWATTVALVRWDNGNSAAILVIVTAPALVLAGSCFMGYRWARGAASF